MKDYYIKMQQNRYLMQDDINDIINDYTKFLNIDLDNLGNIESLIKHQKFIIDVDQYLLLIQKAPNQKIEYLISIYDNKIQKAFNQFSKNERKKLIDKYGLTPLYNIINNLTTYSNIEEICSNHKMMICKISNDLRLLNNLKLIEFDGYNVNKINHKQLKFK